MIDPEALAQTAVPETLPSGAEPSSPPEPEPAAPPSDGLSKEARDRLAQSGREAADARRRAQAAEQQVVALNAQLQQQNSHLSQMEQYLLAQQRAAQEAALAALPPDQRALAEVQMLRQQLDRPAPASASPPPPAALTTEERERYTQQRSAQLVGQANSLFELAESQAITGEERELDWSNEANFIASLNRLAVQRLRSNGAPPTEEPPVATAKPKTETPEEAEARIAAKVRQDVIKELGVGGSNAAKPTGASLGETDLSREAYDKIAYGRTSKDGMAGTVKRLREMRDEAKAAARQ